MSEWLSVITTWTIIPETIKEVVEKARDVALYLGAEKLGVAEIRESGVSYYVIRKDDFEEWFGD